MEVNNKSFVRQIVSNCVVCTQEILHKRFFCVCARDSIVYAQFCVYVYKTAGCIYADVGCMSMKRLGGCVNVIVNVNPV